MIITSPITPQTHPHLFVVETIAGFDYHVAKEIGIGIQEDLSDAYHEAYAEMRTDETKDGIDEALYDAWVETKEGKRRMYREAVKLLFIPIGDAPPAIALYNFIKREQVYMALGFTTRPSDASTSELVESSTGTESNPDSSEASPSPSN